ncbi:phosphotransferase [Paenibacillus rhizovicinus]|uniref:Phosphotransferase n=1 Tax=Paenibacillus rhizovicinus TaxID=2704463 RepID=A0A6C0P4E4_9BACL|nr:phosphotransferase [Paenibacillus rhizovicinus]QHW33414.1 phosphotransferase [Paenibacillus rhizovicinus]
MSKFAVSNEALEHACRLYGTNASVTTFIGGLQNLVYAYAQDGQDLILRLTPSANRTELLVLSELDWIRYLAGKGISVSQPIRSKNGQWTEQIHSAHGDYICAAFERAAGRRVDYPECLEDVALYERLGRLTGKLHALSSTYQPVMPTIHRHDWEQNWFLQHIDLLPETQTGVRDSYFELLESIRGLPKTDEAYGLIHGDINVGNFMVDDQGEVTLFDFDEAQYSWFVEDIAVQLYYLVYVYGGDDGLELREEQASRFMEQFMKGYQLEHALDEYWVRQLPLFLRLREIIVYIGSFRNWDGDETFSGSNNPWFIDWIAESRSRIENRQPIVNIWDR